VRFAFGVGVVFLVVGRTELFNENFFDPAAKAIDEDGSWLLGPSLRLWTVTLVVNLVGGFLFAFVFAVDGVLPSGSAHALSRTAEGIVHRPMRGMFASAIIGGALVSLLSYLLEAANSVRSRITIAYIVGFLLARPVRPRDRHRDSRFFGFLFSTGIGYWALAETVVIATAGNVVGDWVWSRSPTSPRCGARGLERIG